MPRRATYFPDSFNKISLEDAKASDANVLMAQYRRGGTMPRVNVHTPLYGDFTGPEDLQAQMDRVDDAIDRFQQLPADVRTLCDNHPVEFLRQFDDPDEREKLEAAGLITETPTEPPTEPSTEPSPPTPEPPVTAPTPEPTPDPTPQ